MRPMTTGSTPLSGDRLGLRSGLPHKRPEHRSRAHPASGSHLPSDRQSTIRVPMTEDEAVMTFAPPDEWLSESEPVAEIQFARYAARLELASIRRELEHLDPDEPSAPAIQQH